MEGGGELEQVCKGPTGLYKYRPVGQSHASGSKQRREMHMMELFMGALTKTMLETQQNANSSVGYNKEMITAIIM